MCDDDNRIAEVEPLPDAHPQKHTDLTGNELLVATSWDSSATAPDEGRSITLALKCNVAYRKKLIKKQVT